MRPTSTAAGPSVTTAKVLATALTAAAGSVDAIAFTTLGDTFASVMTGNLVLLGIAAGRQDASMAVGLAVAVVGFVLGSLAGSAIAGSGTGRGVWPRRVTAALTVELAVLAAFLALWETSGAATADRADGARLVLLATATVAMGLQSGAIRAVDVPGLSTTYLTGTLVGFLHDLVTTGRPPWRSAAILVALVAGAAVAVVLLNLAPRVPPALPVGLVLVVVVVTWSALLRDRRGASG